MSEPRKVIDLPEGPFLGALERAVEALQGQVETALEQVQAARHPLDTAAEASAALADLARVCQAAVGEAGGTMAFGVGERPERSVGAHLAGVDYPADRDELVQEAADSEAPPEVINFLKNLPRERYDTEEMVFRDLAEAARRYAMHGHATPVGSIDRRNLGRDAVEENIDGNPKHP